MTSRRPWWQRPTLRRDASAYRQVVAGALTRDRAAQRRLDSSIQSPTPEEAQANFFAAIAALSVHSEDVGGFAAEALLATGLPAPLRAALIRAMWDEVRHSDMFLQLADTLGVDAGTADLRPVLGLLETLDQAVSPAEFAILHTELEALALDVFRLIARAVPESRIGDTYAVVATDEATHVRLGLSIVEHLRGKGERVDQQRIGELLDRATIQTPQGDRETLAMLCGLLGLPDEPVASALRRRQQRRHNHYVQMLATLPT